MFKKYVQMVVVLVAISLASGFALGGLYQVTHEKAENNILKFKKVPAVADIMEGLFGELAPQEREQAEEAILSKKLVFQYTDQNGEPAQKVIFVIEKQGKPYAAALEMSGKGFGGPLGVMVGFNLETGDLAGIGITTMSETPGVGSRVKEKSFTLQFIGMSRDSVFKVKKDGGDIDAVTGATISSRAVSAAVQAAVDFYKAHEEEIKALIEQGGGSQ